MKTAMLDEADGALVPREALIVSRETNWGVVVTENPQDKKSVIFRETTLRSLGVLVILGGGAISLFSGRMLSTNPIVTAVGLAAAFAFVGFSIHRYASNGFRSEIRIDTRFGIVRIGTINADNDFSTRRTIQKRDVESFFIRSTDGERARLCVSLKKNSRKIVMMGGPEGELLPPMKRAHEALFEEKPFVRWEVASTNRNVLGAHLVKPKRILKPAPVSS